MHEDELNANLLMAISVRYSLAEELKFVHMGVGAGL